MAINVLFINTVLVVDNAYSLYDFYDHALAQEILLQGSWNLQFW